MKFLKILLLNCLVFSTSFAMQNNSDALSGLPNDIWNIILDFSLNRYAITPEIFFQPMDSIRSTSRKAKENVDNYVKNYAEKKYKKISESERKKLVANFTYNNFKNDIVKELVDHWEKKYNLSRDDRFSASQVNNLHSAMKVGARLWHELNSDSSQFTEKQYINLAKMGYIGEDAFIYAIFYKKNNIVKEMLKAGINPNYSATFYYQLGSKITSPLNMAIDGNNIEIVETLLGNGLLEPGYITASTIFNDSKNIKNSFEETLSVYKTYANLDAAAEDTYKGLYKIFKLLINNSVNLKKEFIESLISEANKVYSSIFYSLNKNRKIQLQYIDEIIKILKENKK